MNQTVGISAAEWLQGVSPDELTRVLKQTCHALDPPVHERVAHELIEYQRRNGGAFKSTREFTAMLKEIELEQRAEHPNLKLPSIGTHLCSVLLASGVAAFWIPSEMIQLLELLTTVRVCS